MLNRRSLRIKVMQYLYALERHKEAYQSIARDKSGAHFDPDINVDELPDFDELNRLKNEAMQAFDDRLKNGSINLTTHPDAVQEAIKDGFDYYEDLLKQAKKEGYDALLKEANWVASNYVKMLILPLVWKDQIVIEWNKAVGAGKSLSSGFRNLSSNPLIEAIESHKDIQSQVKKNKIAWDEDTSSEWLRQIVRKDELYQQYIENPKPNLEDHVNVVNHLFKKIIFKNEVIDGYMEEHDLGWAENRGVLKSMIIKTLKSFDPAEGSIMLINLSPNWKEDKEFFQKLYLETVADDEQLEKIIEEKSQNWDLERIASIDRVIMKMAITEFMKFPSIPVKVTINEYIELCKAYSTPKSKQYVNGILDVLSNEFREIGKIKKSGRGLLDNK